MDVTGRALKSNAGFALLVAYISLRFLYPSFLPAHSKFFITAIFIGFVVHALLVLSGRIRFRFNTFRHPTDPEGVRNLFFGMDLFTCAIVLIAASCMWWLGGGYVFLIACCIATLEGGSAIVDYRRGRKVE